MWNVEPVSKDKPKNIYIYVGKWYFSPTNNLC